jgi:hypothetical protein
VPTEADWDTLTAYLLGLVVAGGKLKETGTVHWLAPNAGATDEVGFKSLPAGLRDNTGVFASINGVNILWSTTDDGLLTVSITLSYDIADAVKTSYERTYGFSVRLMRDLADIPDPAPEGLVIFTDGISIWRKGVRNLEFVLDKATTPLGFAGVENTDWVNVRSFV